MVIRYIAQSLSKRILRMCWCICSAPAILVEKILEFRKGERCHLGDGARLLSPSRIINMQIHRRAINIGDRTQVLGHIVTHAHGGKVEIGTHCFIGEETRIWSSLSIKIGNRVLISHNVNIHDTNSHSLSAKLRHQHFQDIFSTGHPKFLEDVSARPIIIEDDVWIGFNSTILKGVTIGTGAIVGASSLVKKNVPPYAIVAGNPATIIGSARE